MPKKPKVTLESHPKVEDNLPPKSATQKPTARTLVGGESWTGKLPVNILSEYCQKNKWEKPEYSMVQNSLAVCQHHDSSHTDRSSSSTEKETDLSHL